jgi:hypothetical protein
MNQGFSYYLLEDRRIQIRIRTYVVLMDPDPGAQKHTNPVSADKILQTQN